VEYFATQRNWKEAYEAVEKMRAKKIPVMYFIQKKTIVDIYKYDCLLTILTIIRAMNVPITFQIEEENNGDDGIAEEVNEDVN
jgi:hypothetical protein